MSNMSYCRFQNTLHDLEDCVNQMTGQTEEEEELSSDEKRARMQLIQLCVDIADEFTTQAANGLRTPIEP